MKNLRETGITLVAIIATVVVLIILAGVTLTITLSGNSLLARAEEAKIISEISAIIEKIELSKTDEEYTGPIADLIRRR